MSNANPSVLRRLPCAAEPTERLPLHCPLRFFLFPRPCRRNLVTAGFADEPGVLQALTDHTDNADQEPARVSVLALVESERQIGRASCRERVLRLV